MSATLDESGRLVDPEAEVRKLQKLVQRLTEERNQYLKNNTNHKHQNTELSGNIDGYNKENKKEAIQGVADISLDDVELLDVSCLENLDEEDSWLYRSPKKPSPSQEKISPYKWLREEFDCPSPELESARKSLLLRLDELSRFPRSPSSGSLGSPVSPVNNAPNTQHLRSVASTGCMPSIRQPLLGLGGNKIDTNTFTRPKKKPVPNPNKNQPTVQHELTGVSNTLDRNNSGQGVNIRQHDTSERNNNQNGGNVDVNANGHMETSGGSQENLGMMHKLNDVTDVQVLAKMQEQSLRQSMNSPYLPRRKSFSENNPDGLDLDMCDPDCDPGESRIKRSNNSLASLSSHSNSPPGSPYGSQYLDQKTQTVLNDSHGHRRSMPNLARGAPGSYHLPSSSNDSSLHERNVQSQSYRSQVLSRTQTYRISPNRQLEAPKVRGSCSPSRTLSPNRAASPQRAYSPQRTISPQRAKLQKNSSSGRMASPQRSAIPAAARTGIPRPGSTSKLPTPRRSSIPSVRRSLATPRTNDESWKDGCY